MDSTEQISATGERPKSAQLLAESTYLRSEAVNHLEQIKAFKAEIEANGGLTQEDRDFIREWLETEVATRAELADQKDRQLEAIAAGEIVNKVVVTTDHEGVVMTQSDVDAVKQGNGDTKAASGGGKVV